MGTERRVRAMTLAEVLVMMIVAGVVFLAVMDGFGLLRRHAMKVAGRITENSSFYEGYYRLEELVANADSITRNDSGAIFWRGGAQAAGVALIDSMLIARYAAVSDTLMRRVEMLRLASRVGGGNVHGRVDTLAVVVRTGAGNLTVAFPATPPVQVVAAQNIAQREEEYIYE
ncbi:MAG: hypothetical protein FWE10_07430 [Rikenellaceae bacterium]|nr:hypothetical protein [Rikenellaceae bacterium]